MADLGLFPVGPHSQITMERIFFIAPKALPGAPFLDRDCPKPALIASIFGILPAPLGTCSPTTPPWISSQAEPPTRYTLTSKPITASGTFLAPLLLAPGPTALCK